MPDEADEEKYRYYVRDHQGSVLAMTDHEQNKEEYTYDSWGEHIDTDSLPDVANRIRYAGARIECFVTPGQETDAIYETGARHYWPKYGRFLQRDPLTYQKMPRPSNPFTVNPYIYAENNPVMKTDLSGLIPTGYIRGCKTPDKQFFLGTSRPSSTSFYDCCGNGFNEVSDDKVDEMYFYHTGQGLVNIGKWKKKEHLEDVGLCELPYDRAQPNETCPQLTYIPSDLCCTILMKCKGGKCPSPPPPPPPQPEKKPWREFCPNGFSNIDYGYEGKADTGNLSQEDELDQILDLYTKWVAEYLIGIIEQDIKSAWGLNNPNPILYWGPARALYGLKYDPLNLPGCHNVSESLYNYLTMYNSNIFMPREWKYWHIVGYNLGFHEYIRIIPKKGYKWFWWYPFYGITLDPWLDPNPSNPYWEWMMWKP